MRLNKQFLTGMLTVFIVASVILVNENRNINNRVAELEEENEQLKDTDKVEKIRNYFEELPEDSKFFGYTDWAKARNFSEHFYADSDGKFKKEWGFFLALEASSKDIDPFLIYELLKVETGGTFDPNTVGPKTRYGHAYGMAQFMENTGPWIAEMAGLNFEEEDLFDPYFSIQLAITYLDFLYTEYEDWNRALTAYHRGMGGLQQYIKENGHAKSQYAVQIQENAEARDLIAFDK